MHFRVLEGKEPRPVELMFGRETDLNLLREWRLPPRLRRHEPARDAVDFARLATKRWRYYRQNEHTVTRALELRDACARLSSEELAFLLLARAEWSTRSPILGLAHCRRTCCGHVFLDFLSVHPRIVAQQQPIIKGVGPGFSTACAKLPDDAVSRSSGAKQRPTPSRSTARCLGALPCWTTSRSPARSSNTAGGNTPA